MGSLLALKKNMRSLCTECIDGSHTEGIRLDIGCKKSRHQVLQ